MPPELPGRPSRQPGIDPLRSCAHTGRYGLGLSCQLQYGLSRALVAATNRSDRASNSSRASAMRSASAGADALSLKPRDLLSQVSTIKAQRLGNARIQAARPGPALPLCCAPVPR